MKYIKLLDFLWFCDVFLGPRNFVFRDFVISDSRHLWRRKLQNRKKQDHQKIIFEVQKNENRKNKK